MHDTSIEEESSVASVKYSSLYPWYLVPIYRIPWQLVPNMDGKIWPLKAI